MDIYDIARVCHEANRAFCETQSDYSQKEWCEAPSWQRDSAYNEVKFNLDNPDAPASSSHDSWLKEKYENGWVYGEVKDAKLKTHPCCVLYEELPEEQQAKDHLFKAVVASLRGLL